MSIFEVIPSIALPDRLEGRRSPSVVQPILDSFKWLSRPRRILLTLTAIWVINMMDLAFTMTESLHTAFNELNPLAKFLIGKNPDLLIVYKFGLLTVSSTILLIYRRQRVSELGCWLLFGVYIFVAIRWMAYFDQRILIFADPAINVDPFLGRCLP